LNSTSFHSIVFVSSKEGFNEAQTQSSSKDEPQKEFERLVGFSYGLEIKVFNKVRYVSKTRISI